MRYRVVLPPTWVLVPVREGAEQAIRRQVDALFDPKKRDLTVRARRTMRLTLERIAAHARESGGLDLLLPASVPWPMPLSAGVVTSVHEAPPDLTVGAPMPTFAGQARREITELIDLPDPAGSPEPSMEEVADEPVRQLRRVIYTWPVPERAGQTFLASLVVCGQAVPAYRPLTEAMTTLVDTMLSTLTWENTRDDQA
ncbi:hypothetical protein [Xylanimonas ulmi]|uniref:Uncharacterized protein n=1 Tax=Xylanimonas ulmi TaxID=228973 RepID=A0A4Q7M0Y7_9MICO|nr:hypothetical protein [Xylanibacterium ulmi]RZS61044.1 hypothetical protein EV386_1325 [Xylanibacterium ulmi]